MKILAIVLILALLTGCAARVRVWPPQLDLAMGDAWVLECEGQLTFDEAGNPQCEGESSHTWTGHVSEWFAATLGKTVDAVAAIAMAIMPRGFVASEGGE